MGGSPIKWGGGMTFCMKYIIRGVLINGNGYAKFPKNEVYPSPPPSPYNQELESTGI